MNNILKIVTLVGAGLIIGSVAGKFIRQDKIILSRILGEKENEIQEIQENQGLKEVMTPGQNEDPVNIFI